MELREEVELEADGDLRRRMEARCAPPGAAFITLFAGEACCLTTGLLSVVSKGLTPKEIVFNLSAKTPASMV